MTPNEIPSGYNRVTEILYPFSGLSAIDPDIVANAAARGTKVHEICEGIARGLGDFGVSDDVKPYVDLFKMWWNDEIKVVSIEERFFCDELKITGKIDFIIETPEGHVIVDIKTSYKESKTWPLQGSAYAYMANKAGYNIVGIQFLHLNKLRKKPKIISYENQFDLFKKCLDVYRYFFGVKNAK